MVREPGRMIGKHRQEDWRYEGWMDEDDLLGEDYRHEQDLRHRLLEGRGGGDAGRGDQQEEVMILTTNEILGEGIEIGGNRFNDQGEFGRNSNQQRGRVPQLWERQQLAGGQGPWIPNQQTGGNRKPVQDSKRNS